MSTYKIEEVAKECGLTKRTIRYYEEIGLIPPPERSEGGFRLYTDQHVERLKQIINARDVLGISLQELQEFVAISEEFISQRDEYKHVQDDDAKRQKLEELEKTLSKQLRLIDQRMEKLTELRTNIGQLHDRVTTAQANMKSDRE
ncbi:MerR family transcriptional regulator [Cohnella endophytica]|uniref:MerR family transcriptional regulator n=1 Tax=Cohnella endophytica TaxID=2419778 RepID=A0A494XPV0_9BACL|nr:MerR family transcriptional regulator [Cohnella endophytica]RKP51731.1 MerR family transcriptional regulator [Cohnella endophytica]